MAQPAIGRLHGMVRVLPGISMEAPCFRRPAPAPSCTWRVVL